ncbi:MAG TPA: hypothetical protein VMB02_10135 [Candidatus Aquilonibacter sp.]|nr:hypothetical protein [Candidatus Aquilonibacter sp.]
MKLLKAASLLAVLAVLIVPAAQAHQTSIQKTVARDLATGPFPPPHVR